MRSIIFIFFLITSLNASDDTKASEIFNLIVKEITKKENSTVYIHTNIYSIEQYPGNINIADDCKEADLVILSTTKNIPKECKGKILFGSRYSHMKDTNVVGSFFWQKGRPNILFYQKRLKKHNINLDPSFNRYIEK